MARRTPILLACTAVAALALTGCGSSSDDSAGGGSSAKKVTLTFWGTYGNGGNSAQTDALEKTVIPAFEKANPGITIKYVDMPYDSLLQKLTTGAAAGQLPDLVRADIGWVPKFGALKVFAPLDQEMSGFQKLADDTYPGSLATNRFGDHYYGLPLDTNTRVMISNPDALKKAGIAQPPATFSDLKADAPKLAAHKISVYADSGLQGWNVYPWIWSAGGSVTNPDQTKATGYLNSPQSVAGVQMLVNLYKQGAIPNLIIGNKGAVQTSDGLPKATYATILDGPWMADIWKGQYADFKPVYSPVPAGPGGSVSVVGGEDIAMTTASKDHAAAEKFIAFTQTADYQIAMAKTGQMSVVKSLDPQESAAVPAFAPFIKQLATAKPRPSVPQAPAIDTALQDELTKAFEGKESVQDALDKAAAAIDPLLTQAD
ncbi:extracellular solute-binding protein [Nocardioides sp. BP30]|uniref:extracellular solute-binding protein n=1 Tax=Nocardioides sp. BP30 TaxID=3036374 RepID=UPI0024686064|nr:extracellular solute-binding protein [Nocardioides sp. BP30]WGL52178.1 extracellular solute-binding protein [Nocardioides sp. BP30]